MSEAANISIIGGGAAGLTAAIFAAESAPRGTRVVILDGARSLGAKILVAGGGRCNVTHDVVTAADFNGSPNIVKNVLAAFDAAATVRWFESLGVTLKREETGKLFPTTDSARTVLNALVERCGALGITIQTSHCVKAIEKGQGDADPFVIAHEHGTLHSQRVIICTGGKSLPRSGSDGSGWAIVEGLGHSVTTTHAALVPLVLAPPSFHADLSGIAHPAELSTFVDGKRVDRRTGNLLWTHFGISGPVVMDASRHWTTARDAGASVSIRCSFLPGETLEQVERWIMECCESRPKSAIGTVVSDRLPERVAVALLRASDVDAKTPLGQLSRDRRRQVARTLTEFALPVGQHRGWNYAEVTAGGVPLREIDFRTMQSRKMNGLYLAGEILDCDGRIGGFNFQWAWATGYLSGRAAAVSLKTR